MPAEVGKLLAVQACVWIVTIAKAYAIAVIAVCVIIVVVSLVWGENR